MKQRVCGDTALILRQPSMETASMVESFWLGLRHHLDAADQSMDTRPHGWFAGGTK